MSEKTLSGPIYPPFYDKAVPAAQVMVDIAIILLVVVYALFFMISGTG